MGRALALLQTLAAEFPRQGNDQLDFAVAHFKFRVASFLNSLAWKLVRGTDPQPDDIARAIVLAKKVVELAQRAGNFWNTLGVAYYRASDWSAAVTALEKSKTLPWAVLARGGRDGDCADWLVLAMAHWKLGHEKEARACYETGIQLLEKNPPKDYEDVADLQGFRAEAEKLLGLKEK